MAYTVLINFGGFVILVVWGFLMVINNIQDFICAYDSVCFVKIYKLLFVNWLTVPGG